MPVRPRTISIAFLAGWIGCVVDAGVAATLCVNPSGSGGCFSTIQAAVNAASSGDVIQIEAGDYPSGADIQSKRLTLQGAGAGVTTIGDGLYITALSLGYARATVADVTLRNANYCVSGDHSRVQLVRVVARDCYVSGTHMRLKMTDSTTDNAAISALYSNIRVLRSTIANAAVGIVSYAKSRVLIDTCTVSGNAVGIRVEGPPGTTRIRRSTIAANGDGVACPSGLSVDYADLTVVIDGSIIADNSGPCTFPDLDSDLATTAFIRSSGFNLIEDGDASLVRARSSDTFGVDPMLGPLQNNGGPTATHAILAGSPAIGAVVDLARCRTPDQRGTSRLPVPCDIGAFEYP